MAYSAKQKKPNQMNYIHHDMKDDQSFRSRLLESLREIVFGLEDGIVSTLGAVTGIAVGTGDPFIVILSGVVVIFVESLSMGAGTYLSSKSEHEFEERILAEERHEIETEPERERAELVEFYTERGFTPEEVEIIVNRITQNPKLWLEEMAFKELGIVPDVERHPVRDGLIMSFSYIIGGFVPVISYFFISVQAGILTSIALSVVVLFIVGYIKGTIVHVNRIKSGVEMMIVSLSAAGVGYVVAQIVNFLLER